MLLAVQTEVSFVPLYLDRRRSVKSTVGLRVSDRAALHARGEAVGHRADGVQRQLFNPGDQLLEADMVYVRNPRAPGTHERRRAVFQPFWR